MICFGTQKIKAVLNFSPEFLYKQKLFNEEFKKNFDR